MSAPSSDSTPLSPPRKILGLPSQQCLCFAFLLVVISLCFMLGATIAQDWSSFHSGSESRTYGLMRCSDGPAGVAGTNWYCPLEIECQDRPDSGLCALAKDMYNAGNAYMVGQLPTFMLGVMLGERLLLCIWKRDYGWGWVMYVVCGMYPVAMLVAIVLWFASNNVSFEGSCGGSPVNITDKIDVCASDGSQVAIVATILAFIAGATSAIVFFRRPQLTHAVQTGEGRLFGVKTRHLMIVVMLFMLIVVSLYVAAPAHEEWIETDGQMGGLLKLKRWGPYRNVGYDCISEPRCAVDADFGSCRTFRELHQSSMVFLFLEAGAIYTWLLWFEAGCYLLIGREYGVPGINYLTPVLSVLLHSVGTVVWLTRVGAKFETRCGVRPEHVRQRWDVCGKTGAILAIVNVGVGWIAVGLYWLVYYHRHMQTSDLTKLVATPNLS